MSSRSVLAVALGLLAFADTPVLAQPGRGRRGEADAGRSGWLFSLEQGKAEAQRTGKPLMVVARCVP